MEPSRKSEGRRFLLDSLILVGLTQSGSVLHLVFQMMATRTMTKEDYGLFAALMNIFLLVYMPSFTFQAVVSKFSSEALVRDGMPAVRAIGRTVTFAGFVAFAAMLLFFVVFSGPIAARLQSAHRAPVIFLGVFTSLYFTSIFWQGILQGIQRFWRLGISLFSAGFTRCAAGFLVFAPYLAPLVLDGRPLFSFRDLFPDAWRPDSNPQVLTVMVAQAASAVGVAAVVFAFVRVSLRGGARAPAPKGLLRTMLAYGAPLILGNLFYAFALYGDQTIVQSRFAGVDAGLFAYAMIYGKAVIYLPWSFVPVMLPKVTTALAKGEDPAPYLWRTLRLGTLSSLAAFGLAIGFPTTFLRYAGGENTVGAAGLLQGYSIAMFFMGLDYVVMNYLFAINRFKFLVPFGGIILAQTAAMLFIARSPVGCIAIEIAGSAAALVVLLLALPSRKAPAILPPSKSP